MRSDCFLMCTNVPRCQAADCIICLDYKPLFHSRYLNKPISPVFFLIWPTLAAKCGWGLAKL